jgi:hypothetical protein
MKNSETWQTSLFGILTPETAVRGKGSGEGLLYTEYLQALLYLQGSSVKSLRTMDIMEMDIRRTPGNEAFRMDGCLDSFAMEARACDGLGFVYAVTRNVTYN